MQPRGKSVVIHNMTQETIRELEARGVVLQASPTTEDDSTEMINSTELDDPVSRTEQPPDQPASPTQATNLEVITTIGSLLMADYSLTIHSVLIAG